VDDSLIAFVHIPKTAGGTLANMLGRAYTRSAFCDGGNAFLDPAKAVNKISRGPGGWERWCRDGGRVVAGHIPYGMFREHLPADTRYVSLLRDPIDRVVSHYHAHKRALGSLEEALEQAPPELTNLATRMLSGTVSTAGPLTPSDLEGAQANLRRFAFVGLQDRFDESVVLLQRMLGLRPVPYLSRHVSSDRREIPVLTEEQRARVRARNELDVELFELAKTLLAETIARADDRFGRDVEELRRVSATANRMSLENARQWLDRELPPGSTRSKAALLRDARVSGIPGAAVKRVVAQSSVTPRRDENGEKVWTRPADVG